MIPEEYERMMLIYLSSLVEGKGFRTADDLNRLSSRELLLLARKIDDSALGLFVQLLKRSHGGENLFEKLMGDHEEENRPLVDAFFSRYLEAVLSGPPEGYFNPLSTYLPARAFADLGFIQSRQPFFLRQDIEVINEYLHEMFACDHEFAPGEQEEAWKYFWNKVLSL